MAGKLILVGLNGLGSLGAPENRAALQQVFSSTHALCEPLAHALVMCLCRRIEFNQEHEGRGMKNTFILLLMTCMFLGACGEKTADEVKAEKSAKAQAIKNQKL